MQHLFYHLEYIMKVLCVDRRWDMLEVLFFDFLGLKGCNYYFIPIYGIKFGDHV